MTARQKTGGRRKGTPNKTTALLKDAVLKAAEQTGGDDGLIGYLKTQAEMNPGPFMTLLGKVLPKQVDLDAEVDGNITVQIVRFSDLPH